MSGYKNFAVVGAGQIGSYLIRQLITDKAAGTVNDVVVLTRQASFTSAAAETHALIGCRRDLKPLLTLPPS
jgi:saccharopine dehydrogenase-like NADP-dependent oxidoreductase